MLTTSQRIAVRFSLTIAGIVFFLGVIINGAFFGSRRKREQSHIDMQTKLVNQEIVQMQRMQRKFAKKGGGELGPRNMLFVSLGGEEQKELAEHTVFSNLAHFEDEWYMYGPTPQGDQLLVVDVSPIVQNQLALLRITFIAILVSSGFGYLIAVYTVKKGLRDLHILADKVQTIDIDSLAQTRSFSHLPDHDEIQIVGHALQQMTEKVYTQVATIKQFVANVSHEFKTPLMSLQSTIDLGEKTKQYEAILTQSREQIAVMHRLLDTLTTLTRIQKDGSVEKHTVHIVPLLVSLIHVFEEKYPAITFVQEFDHLLTLSTNQGFFERIVTNLLDNAGKFTADGGMVTVSCDKFGVSISDTGSGISTEQLEAIREPFWQGDAARGTVGFGLGLSLVQQLVTLLDRDIVVKSSVGKGTIVTLKR